PALTVNMAKFAGPVTAQWFDPTNGTYSKISGSPFANTGRHNFSPSGNNSAGDPDFVLLLTV
ncbi:MAG: putative collagen-binding domain-containing protein, partial [Steroidobacteraceae bacterium]